MSRRAFPRGYTESLEERVRSLEQEVRELKELLDEKDEKIDMLSRIHSQSIHPIHLSSPRRPSATSTDSTKNEHQLEFDEPDEIFRVSQSPYLLGEGSDSYFSGTSSTRNLIDAFKQRCKELGKADVVTDDLLPSVKQRTIPTPSESATVWNAPPRLISDQLINIYFQEWAPLFPVLHRPSFLKIYGEYVVDADSVSDKASLAHLNLVFGIAALSSDSAPDELEAFEQQWRTALDTIMNENSVETLQALVLAQMYCLQKGDLSRLLTYKGLSTTLSARLGLHQTQKPFALGPLVCETRKKLFWTLYTLDR